MQLGWARKNPGLHSGPCPPVRRGTCPSQPSCVPDVCTPFVLNVCIPCPFISLHRPVVRATLCSPPATVQAGVQGALTLDFASLSFSTYILAMCLLRLCRQASKGAFQAGKLKPGASVGVPSFVPSRASDAPETGHLYFMLVVPAQVCLLSRVKARACGYVYVHVYEPCCVIECQQHWESLSRAGEPAQADCFNGQSCRVFTPAQIQLLPGRSHTILTAWHGHGCSNELRFGPHTSQEHTKHEI
eukprot:386723-Pelagomonas_calceolata.AAC.3